MLIFLYLVFREWRGVWLPFLVVVMSALLGISLLPILGWKFYVISLLVPILLIAVANDYGIHMIARYQELNASGNGSSMKEMAGKITKIPLETHPAHRAYNHCRYLGTLGTYHDPGQTNGPYGKRGDPLCHLFQPGAGTGTSFTA